MWALGEQPGDRVLGLVQVAAAALALALTGAVIARGSAARGASLALSGVLVLLGLAAAVVQLADRPVFWQDVLLVSLPSAIGGAVTALLARPGRREGQQSERP